MYYFSTVCYMCIIRAENDNSNYTHWVSSQINTTAQALKREQQKYYQTKSSPNTSSSSFFFFFFLLVNERCIKNLIKSLQA